MNTAETSIPGIERWEKPALVGGLVALVLCAALGFRDPTQFFRSYLLAFVFWIGVPLGCSAILMLHHMVGGTWGFLLRRPLESGTKTFFLMAVLVLILAGTGSVVSYAPRILRRSCSDRQESLALPAETGHIGRTA